ncbi:MAG TPA: polysaccharide deacetylase family protein [Puia sp.]|nr:polysaccharide deacetylase family protein [Puia sp.]
MWYFVKTPWWLLKLYGRLVWRVSGEEKAIYLTFDDGPNPVATPFVLEELKKYGARATFFCIGKNVEEQPELYRRILLDGHRVGNHTHNHLNGWKVDGKRYVDNVREAAKRIDSDLFRPPYGRIGLLQSRVLRAAPFHYQIVMWDVLSADFDVALTGEHCARNVYQNGKAGSIVVFHDSEKAFERLRVALPLVLEKFSNEGYRFEAIRTQNKIGPG